MEELLTKLIGNDELHAKWLNTLSFLENCGARKIAACEHPTLVKVEMLKHAEEEFRHAYHLKRQIEKIAAGSYKDYSQILGGLTTRRYLYRLDTQVCRLLKNAELFNKELAYALVTFAIEKRAIALYTLYETLLRENQSKITLKAILLEEANHLEEMEAALSALPIFYIEQAIEIETDLFHKCLMHIKMELFENSV